MPYFFCSCKKPKIIAPTPNTQHQNTDWMQQPMSSPKPKAIQLQPRS